MTRQVISCVTLSLFCWVVSSNAARQMNSEVRTLQKKIVKQLNQVKKKHPDSRDHVYRVLDSLGLICTRHKKAAQELEAYRRQLRQIQNHNDETQENEAKHRQEIHTIKEQLAASEQTREEQQDRLEKLALVNDELQRQHEVVQNKEQKSTQRVQMLEESLRKMQPQVVDSQ